MSYGDIVRITPRAMYVPAPLALGDLGVVRSTGRCTTQYGAEIVLVEFVMERTYWMLREALEVV